MRSLNRFGQMGLFIGGLLAGWYAPSQLVRPDPQPVGYLLIVVALAAFALLATQKNHGEFLQPTIIIRRELWPIIIGALIAWSAIALPPVPGTRPWLILLLWIAGWVSILVGAWLLDRTAAIIPEQRFARWEIYAVAALTIVALLARGVLVDSIPFSVHGDEGEMGVVARSVLDNTVSDPFVTAFLDHPTLWFFLQALSLRLVRDTLGGLRFC